MLNTLNLLSTVASRIYKIPHPSLHPSSSPLPFLVELASCLAFLPLKPHSSISTFLISRSPSFFADFSSTSNRYLLTPPFYITKGKEQVQLLYVSTCSLNHH